MKPLAEYFKGSYAELKRVQWPTRATLVRNFLSVVFGIAAATAFIGLLDVAFIKALGLLIK